MPLPVNAIISGVIALIDWQVTRAKAAGEEIPDEVIEQRTALRKALAEQANEVGNETGNQDN